MAGFKWAYDGVDPTLEYSTSVPSNRGAMHQTGITRKTVLRRASDRCLTVIIAPLVSTRGRGAAARLAFAGGLAGTIVEARSALFVVVSSMLMYGALWRLLSRPSGSRRHLTIRHLYIMGAVCAAFWASVAGAVDLAQSSGDGSTLPSTVSLGPGGDQATPAGMGEHGLEAILCISSMAAGIVGMRRTRKQPRAVKRATVLQ